MKLLSAKKALFESRRNKDNLIDKIDMAIRLDHTDLVTEITKKEYADLIELGYKVKGWNVLKYGKKYYKIFWEE